MDFFENVHCRDKCVTERNEIIAYGIHGCPECDISKSGRSKVGKVKVRLRVDSSLCHSLDGPEADGPSESYYQELDVSETHGFLFMAISWKTVYMYFNDFCPLSLNNVRFLLFRSFFLEKLAFTDRKSFYDEII